MAKKESDSTASEKILELYNLLLFSRRSYSHTELAKKLVCSKSSITRYIMSLEKLYPDLLVKEKQGNSVLYSFKDIKGTKTNIALNNEELELLEMCKLFTSHISDTQKEKLAFTLDKVITAHKKSTAKYDESTEHIGGPIPIFNSIKGRINTQISQHILNQVMKAISEQKVCLITSTQGKTSEIAITHLLANNDALYAQGYFVTTMGTPEIIAPVGYYIHRMKEIILTPRTHDFKQKQESIKNFGAMEGDSFQAQIHFRDYAVAYVKDRLFSEDQSFEDLEDGSTILTLTANNHYELMSWVMSFGSSATLLSPENVQNATVEQLKESLEIYNNL